VGAEITKTLDVNKASELYAVSDEIAARWGRLDALLHSTVFAPKLHPKFYGASVDVTVQATSISITTALETAQRRVLTNIQED
jgi:enoyl-[acyl-carrier-protein] reductase (NADH)